MSVQMRGQPIAQGPLSSSEASSLQEEDLQAVRMQRVDTPIVINVSSPVKILMPPWLRQAVTERKRQLAVTRAHASAGLKLEQKVETAFTPSRLTVQHFGTPTEDKKSQHHFVSEWIDGLPERLTGSWETVLREEAQDTFSNSASERRTQDSHIERVESTKSKDITSYERQDTFFEDLKSDEFYPFPGALPITEGYSSAQYDEDDDEFLVNALLGRKSFMQAEISIKRLKMGLKYVTSSLCAEFSNVADTERSRELLAEVDNTYGQVVCKHLSNATAIGQQADHNDEENQIYRSRLRAMRNKDPGFILRVYNEEEINELKTMVIDILDMDERNGDNEGADWFWNMLPMLLELRGDMAEAEREFIRQEKVAKKTKTNRPSIFSQPHPFIALPLSVWDLYYHQYIWMQSALSFRPIGSWYAFSIPVEDEVETQDWQLRIEQRVWLQEHFSLTLGAKEWLPFRQAMIPAY